MASILVAEDDQSVRDFVLRALGHYGHEVTGVADGAAALAELNRRTFDLMLTDIAMPGIDGVALVTKAAAAYPGMAVMMMTGIAAERERAHNLQAPVRAIISKPFGLREIHAAVNAALTQYDA